MIILFPQKAVAAHNYVLQNPSSKCGMRFVIRRGRKWRCWPRSPRPSSGLGHVVSSGKMSLVLVSLWPGSPLACWVLLLFTSAVFISLVLIVAVHACTESAHYMIMIALDKLPPIVFPFNYSLFWRHTVVFKASSPVPSSHFSLTCLLNFF